jgi:hypothetical protein
MIVNMILLLPLLLLPLMYLPGCLSVCWSRSSSRILNLTVLVMGYGIAHKLFGFVWKGQMKVLYPSTAEYTTVMGDVASYTGATTIGLMLISKYVFQVRQSSDLHDDLHRA